MLKLPIVKPLLALLNSRKFIVALLAGLYILAALHWPELAPYQATVLGVAFSLILGISAEDAGKAVAGSPHTLSEAVATTLTEAEHTLISPELPNVTPAFIISLYDLLEKEAASRQHGTPTVTTTTTTVAAAKVDDKANG